MILWAVVGVLTGAVAVSVWHIRDLYRTVRVLRAMVNELREDGAGQADEPEYIRARREYARRA